MTDTIEKKPVVKKTFRLRFKLRSFLIFITVVCSGIGWYTHRAESQRRAVEWVHANGGNPHYDYELNELNAERKSFPPVFHPPGPRWMHEILGVDYFGSVVCVNSMDLAVSDVKPLAGMATLEKLDLSNTQIHDLSPLANLRNLKILRLEESRVIDLAPLASLRNLEELDLSYNQVSDLSPLAELTNLVYLNIEMTQVSDLTPLARLTSLEDLRLDGTRVSNWKLLTGLVNLKILSIMKTPISEDQAEELQKAFPDCDVFFLEY